MSNINKYNIDEDKWKVIGTTNASEITSNNPDLVNYVKETPARVENILQKVVNEVNTAKSNIAWLALHGGGGTPGGGGGISVTGEILVNDLSTGATIIRKDTDDLKFIVKQTVTQSWDYTITFNNKIIKTGNVTKGTVIIANDSNPLNYNEDGQGYLSITCSSGLTNIYWTGTIIKNQLHLSAPKQVVTSLDEDGNLINTPIKYTYSGSIEGDYELVINNTKSYIVNIPKSGSEYVININVGDLYNYNNIGSNTTVATLTKVGDTSIQTSFINQVVITSDEIVISSNTLSQSTSVSKNSTIPCIFIAYLTGEVFYTYEVTVKSIIGTEIYKTTGSGQFGVMQYLYINTSSVEYIPNNTYVLTVNINTSSGLSASKDYGILITDSLVKELPLPKPESLLSDFCAFYPSWTSRNELYRGDGGELLTITHDMVLKDNNILSGHKLSEKDPPYYRLSNKAYAVTTLWNINNTPLYFSQLTENFTISLCFKADYHSEDNRTIFQFGKLNSNLELQKGILIKVHELQVKSSKASISYELQDDEVYNIDIVYNASEELRVYINGVITKALKAFDFEDSFIEEQHYLGCSYREGESFNHSDCQFYRVMFYNSALNDYDILLNYLQNRAYTNFVDGKPDNDQIEAGLKRNFISEVNGELSSWFWNKNGYYDLSNFITTGSNNKTGISGDIGNYTIPIPLLYLDLSGNSGWSWDNFIKEDVTEGLNRAKNVPFEYYDQKQNNQSIIRGECQIEYQGTSTLTSAIKNLNFINKADEDTPLNMFIPKANWFPEEVYTLKADIVDSSHSLNASIGKFINEVISNNTENAYYPVDSNVWSKISNSNYYVNCESTKPTLKTAVEGFPVFVIIRFYNSDLTQIDVRSLGIYQFILGRNSVHNLGLTVLSDVKDIHTQESISPTVFPFYHSEVEFINLNNEQSYWIEATEQFSNQLNENNQNPLESGQDLEKSEGLTALCWQSHDTILDKQFEVKTPANTKPSAISDFTKLVEAISKSPAVLKNYYDVSQPQNTLQQVKFEETSFKELKFANGQYTATGNDVELFTGDDVQTLSNYLDLTGCASYASVCMAFGLLDNFCKNMPFIKFADSDKYRLGFYDMDSGAGANNNASYTVPTSLYFKKITNSQDGYVTESYQGDGIVSGADNKLWLALEHSGVLPSEGNIYSYHWIRLREFLNSLQGQTDFVNYFINNYFIPQTEGCGELLFNLTYTTKYLNTGQYSYLAGRRIQQVKHWLTDHIDFLDSVAQWKTTSKILSNREAPVNINSFDYYKEIPLKFNKDLVISTTDQGGINKYYTFCIRNEFTSVRYGNGSAVQNPIKKQISHGRYLLEIGDEEVNFGNSGFFNLDSSSPLYGFNTLNLSNCTTISSDLTTPINFESVFFNSDKQLSELRVINLQNTKNIKGVPNIELNLEKFTKLTDIDIRNSSVSTISLPSTPLVSLNIEGSLITELNLSQQNLLKDLNLTGCYKLTKVTVSECSNISNISGFNGLKDIQSIQLYKCDSLKSLDIRDCSVKNITIDIEGLESIIISNCPNLELLNLSGSINLKNITIVNNPKLKSFILSSNTTLNKSLENLDLSNSEISYIQYGQDIQEDLNLTRFSNIKDFNIYNNPSVENIRFANNPNQPIPLKNSFTGCVKLKRIYGHIEVTNTSGGSFNGCKNFSIHGNSFHGKSITKNGVYLMPEEISEDLFYNNPEGTNITLGGTSINSMFELTNCTQFDVYYIFSIATQITTCTRAFAELHTKIFNWSEDVDNSPNRDLFKYAQKLTSLNRPFYNSCGIYKIYSPKYDSNTNTYDNSGLFSKLPESCRSIDWYTHGKYVIDRNCFKSGCEQLRILDDISPIIVVNDINSFNYPNNLDEVNLSEYGNISHILINCPNLESIMRFLNNTLYINYDTATNLGFKVPDNITLLWACFVSKYARGKIKPQNYFNENTNIKYILNSFRVSYKLNEDIASLHLDNNSFAGMPALEMVGHGVSGDFTGITVGAVSSSINASFTGYINKTVLINSDGTICNLFANNNKLTRATGVLLNAIPVLEEGANASDILINLPGNLFSNTPNLLNCSRMFYAFRGPYKLNSEGFKNCKNLKDISYLFAQEIDTSSFYYTDNYYLQGSVPERLFYHGSTNVTRFIQGTNTEPEITEDGNLDFSNITPENDTISYSRPNTTISNISYVFQRSNLDYYSHPEAYTPESNVDYNPFKYIKNISGDWSQATVNTFKKTIIWSYDGNNKVIPENCENLDEDNLGTEIFNIPNPSSSHTNIQGTLNFMCAPDLLRYCTESANVEGLFAYSGLLGHSTYQMPSGIQHPLERGIKGRICPYLLKPVPNTTSIKDMFRQCKCLSEYKDTSSNKTYKIPKNFFKYATKVINLDHAFSGLVFLNTTDLNVFSYLSGPLDISYLFSLPYFESNSSNPVIISGLFSGKNITGLTHLFSIVTTNENPKVDHQAYVRNQYITFGNMFGSVTPQLHNGIWSDSHAFSGYDENTVSIIEPKELDLAELKYNYIGKNGNLYNT